MKRTDESFRGGKPDGGSNGSSQESSGRQGRSDFSKPGARAIRRENETEGYGRNLRTDYDNRDLSARRKPELERTEFGSYRKTGGDRRPAQQAEPQLAGTIVKLPVSREVSPYGYFLTYDDREILLHYTEKTRDIKPGDEVEVFLYHDTEDRLSATMKMPAIRLGEVALLEVADIHPRYGCFLEMGLGRQLLLPFRELPELKELRPQVGDKVFVVLTNDKQGRLIAKLAKEEELGKLCFEAPSSWRNKWVEATVYKPLTMGTFVVCDGGVVGFGVIGMIHPAERIRLLRLGERVKVRIAFIREDGRVNLSMRPPKEIGRNEDSDKLLEVMKQRQNGGMPYSDETPADIILSRFGMSKSAFKRALGKLMKDGVVYQEGSWTYLKSAVASDGDRNGETDGRKER